MTLGGGGGAGIKACEAANYRIRVQRSKIVGAKDPIAPPPPSQHTHSV